MILPPLQLFYFIMKSVFWLLSQTEKESANKAKIYTGKWREPKNLEWELFDLLPLLFFLFFKSIEKAPCTIFDYFYWAVNMVHQAHLLNKSWNKNFLNLET